MIVLSSIFLLESVFFFPHLNQTILIQQILNLVKSPSLVCVPMFILAAEIICSGSTGKKIVNMIRVYIGHITGGMPIVASLASTMFGSVSGSTQATVAAIGKPMYPLLLEAGYSSSFSIGLIINASDIAYLIPPSLGFIIYGVATQTSIGKLFLAGVLPGFLICFLFSIFCYFYSKYNKNIKIYPKSSLKMKKLAIKEGIPTIGFPILILGGIYMGIFSPTEAAAASVLYALILEKVVYSSLTFKKVIDALMSTSKMTAVIYILAGAGASIGWLMGYSGLSQKILLPILGTEPSALKVVFIVNIAYFVSGMFISPIIAIFILTPIFAPYVAQAGIDKVLMGVIVTMQVAIASASPPVGCDIFTAMMIFKRPYLETIRLTWPFIFIILLGLATIVVFPELALFIPRLAFGG